MKKPTKVILLSLTAVLLFASMLQKLFNFPKLAPLAGVVEERSIPALNLQNYRNGSFQQGTEQYLQYNFGFRPPVIKLYNQYLWDFFEKTYVNRASITFGKDGWLYEPWFIEDHYQSLAYHYSTDSADMATKFKNEAKRVYQLQHILNEYGTDLVVCLLPGKDLIYPEHLPDNTKYFKEKKITARDFFGSEYKRLGVNHINVEQWFVQMKDTADFLLFPKTGTHWSNLAAVYAADSLIRYLEHLKNCNLNNLIIGEKYVDKARTPDADLESLMNLIRPLKREPLYYADVKADHDSTAIKPKLITIGDSYWWNVIGQVPLQDVFSAYPYWYYYSTIYFDNAKAVRDVDLLQEMLSSDYILLSYCSVQQYRMNDGFTQQALIALCYNPKEVETIKNGIKIGIQNDAPWFEKIKQRAEKDHLEIDQVLDGEVATLVNLYPEKYFPALRDSIPTKRSSLIDDYFTTDSLAFIEKMVNEIVLEIKSKPQMMIEMEQKAKDQGKELEQAIHDDAQWIVNHRIENGTLVMPTKKKGVKTTNSHGI